MVMLVAVTPGVEVDAPALAPISPVEAVANAKAELHRSAATRRFLFPIFIVPPIS
jgi:hypothetical protein